MQIIATDNLARETVADSFVCRFPNNDKDKAKAQEFCDWLNTFSCDNYGGRFFAIKDDDYRLWRGMEELV